MKKHSNDWIRYSTLGLEMAVIIGGFVWGGVAIDRHRVSAFPLFTLLFSFLGLAVALGRLIMEIK